MFLPANTLIEANGSYDIPNLIPGQQYLLTLRSQSPGAATVTLAFDDGPAGSVFTPIQDGALLGSGPSEARLVAPSSTLRLIVNGVAQPIRVNLIPLL